MKRHKTLLGCTLLVLLSLICQGETLRPGKYCGVVIFDRWDGCTLYSGVYLMYVSEKVKERLRPYAGQAIQIEAKEVYQPINPGDALIKQFDYLGAAPATNRAWLKTEGLRLASSVKIQLDGQPIATISIENSGQTPVKIYSAELGMTLLMRREQTNVWTFLEVPDGPSIALITRQSFEVRGSDPRWQGAGTVSGKPYSWTIGRENALPHDFTLGPGEKRQINVQFDLPDGQYDFLCGYGASLDSSSKSTASNLSAFDVVGGKATVPKIENR